MELDEEELQKTQRMFVLNDFKNLIKKHNIKQSEMDALVEELLQQMKKEEDEEKLKGE